MTNKEAIRIIENVNANNNCINCFYKYDVTCEDCRVNTALEKAIEALKNQKVGYWINRHNIYANKTFDTKVCSECQYEYSYDAETGISNANFCPYCGAKMEGK